MLLNNSKILTFIGILIHSEMGNKALKIFYAVFMTLILAALVVFMIMHIREGLAGSYNKLMLAGYILLLLWAGFRVFTLVRELLGK